MRTVALHEIAEQVRGVSYGKADVVDRPAEGYLPVLRANNITEEGLDLGDLVFVRSDKIGEHQRIRSGDIVVAASSGSISVVGKSAQSHCDLDAGFGAVCKVVRPSKRIDHRYLGHFFRTPGYRQKMSALAAGANINNLKNEHIDELEIPLPPLEEQKRIAAVLDQADELRRKRQRAFDRLNQLGQAIFVEMFGAFHDDFGGWPLHRLETLVSDAQIGAVRGAAEMGDEKPIEYLRMDSIDLGGGLRFEGLKRVDASEADISKYSLSVGDLIFNTRNSKELVGKTAVVRKPFGGIYNNNILRIRFNDRMTGDFLDAFLRTRKGQTVLSGIKCLIRN